MAAVIETELQMARRHVAEGRARIEAQEQLISRLHDLGQPTELAEQLLALLKDTIVQMQAHKAYLERAERGG
jgi:hypothetical protein